MDLPLLLAAVERGDDDAVLELLYDTTVGEQVGEDVVTLLAAAARAGRDRVVHGLVARGANTARPWAGGIDPVVWAAENGWYWVLQALLADGRQDRLSSDSPHRRALRAAREALAAGASAGDGPPPAHRAIITELETALGVRHPPDELAARALVHADPDHDDWFASAVALGDRIDRETFDWALAAAGDASDPDRRRFGLDTIKYLAIGFDVRPDDGDDDAELPFEREAESFLRPLLDSEQDPCTLAIVIAAFSFHNTSGDTVAAVLPHARHADPRVRACVCQALRTSVPEREAALAALVRLTDDPVPVTRENALSKLLKSKADTPEVRAAFAAHLTDPHFYARLEAAAGLALCGDERGLAALGEIRAGLKNPNSPGWGHFSTIDHLLRARAERKAGGTDGSSTDRTIT
ncbi:hypothetical protein [Kitasatospora sp. NPDC057198]|uniref:hypothetical protein n=1 Tax=Kitasatospora sp. NPDC057198 TaxID=3346046 RepID=UPI003643C1FD